MGMTYPPGPVNFNAAFGGTWRHWYAMRRDPLRFFTGLGQTYGDIAFFRMFHHRCYFLNHPDLIHSALTTHGRRFQKLPREMRVFARATGDGLLVSEGRTWQHRRRVIAPGFDTESLARAAQAVRDIALETADGWPADGPLEIVDAMSHIMIRATLRVLFGDIPVGDLSHLRLDTRTISQGLMRDASALWQLPMWTRSRRSRIFAAALARTRSSLESMAAQHRLVNTQTDDIMSTLMAAMSHDDLNETQVFNEAMTILFAGNHTATAGLSWLFYELARNPDVQQRARDEAIAVLSRPGSSIEQYEQLTYTKMVLNESLRLHPPAWGLFVRSAVEDVPLPGYRIPSGSWLFIHPYVTHRDARFFPDPLRFDPNRFLSENMTSERQRAFFPFGIGPHACVGRHLAMIQMTLVIAAILRDREFRLTSPDQVPHPEPNTAIWPKGGLTLNSRGIA